MRLIDIHCHILPGVDDGAKNIEESIAMAELAYKDGVRVIVATPHVRTGVFVNHKQDIHTMVKILNDGLTKKGIDVIVLPGAEYQLEPDLPQRLADGKLMTLNDSGLYLLIELPTDITPVYVPKILFELQLQGIIPIIAHPERNTTFIRHPEQLVSYAERGMLAQVTSSSITGFFGKSIQRAAWRAIEYGKGIILASDGHSATIRTPLLLQAFYQIEAVYGREYALTLAYDNPNRVINGESMPVNVTPIKKPIWKSILAKR